VAGIIRLFKKYADRNAIMQVNQFMRSYIKESDAEVKIRQDQFRALHKDLRYHAVLRQTIGLIDKRLKF
jgi:hypothetical protein